MAKTSMAPQAFPERFEVGERLGEGGMGIVYEVYDRDARLHLAAKTLRKMAPEHLYWLKNEFRKLADVQHRNLVQLGELYSDAQQCFFTMELIEGDNFRSYVRGREALPSQAPPDGDTRTMSPASPDSYYTLPTQAVDASLSVAATPMRGSARFDEQKLRDCLRQLADAVMALHARGLVHRDLKPSNVMVEPSGRVVVLDFGLTDTVRRSDNDNADGIYGTAAYMPPEQATKASVGPSADWYAFGVMLFNALTGRLPFEGPSGHVLKAKCELAAPRPSSLIDGCPEDLDELCAALLARDPEERPSGEEVLERLAPQELDKSARIPRRRDPLFVGRQGELARLRAGLAAARDGRFAALLVEGEPGVGKTELVEQFLSSAGTEGRPALVLRGRCYEQEFVPFKGVDALVDSLSRHLKSLDDASVSALLPPRFNLVAALFPVLYRVHAIAAAAPPLSANESKLEHREEAIGQLKQLLRNLAGRSALVLFIDDMQWAGADSFAFLRSLCSGDDAPPMLFLATSRTTDRWDHESEKEPARALEPALGLPLERVSLSALPSNDAFTLMQHLWQPASDARLKELMAEAGGHPLFLQELARYAERAEELPAELRLDQVLRERISRLDSEPRKLLEVSAIAGIPLPARVLARVARITRADSVRALRVLRAEQLVRTETGGHSVECYHDRVREAVVQGIHDRTYESALSLDLPGTHLELARQLLRARVEDDLSVAHTTLANHFNLGASAIRSAEDHREALGRNMDAARQVKLASAYAAAAHYLEAAGLHVVALPAGEQRAIETEIELLAMEVAYLSKDEPLGAQIFTRLVGRSQSSLELARAYETRIMVETAQNQLARAVATAREGLGRLSMRFPEKGSDLLLLRDMALFELKLRGRDPALLLSLPVSNDEQVRAQMQILMAMTPAAYFSDPALMSIAMIRMATLSLSGLTDLSAYGFIGYALVLCAGFQQYPRAGKFSALAMKLNERFQNRALDAKLAHLHHFNVGSYVMEFEACKAGLKRGQELGLQNGDLNFRTYAAICTPMITLCAGQPLGLMKAECVEAARVAEQEGNVDMGGQTQLRLRAIRCLAGENPDPLQMDAPGSTEREFVQAAEQASLPTTLFAHGLLRAVLAVTFGAPRLALEGAEQALKYQHAQFGLITIIDLTLYQTLAACAVAEETSTAKERRQMLALAGKNLKKLKKWGAAHERNFAVHAHLAHGELARVQGDLSTARRELDGAVTRAEARGVHNLAALAHERLAAFHAQQGRESDRLRELDEAALAQRRWGATAAAARLEGLRARLGAADS